MAASTPRHRLWHLQFPRVAPQLLSRAQMPPDGCNHRALRSPQLLRGAGGGRGGYRAVWWLQEQAALHS